MFIISIISIAIYVIAILMISTNIYEFEKEKKVKFILIGIAIIFIVTYLLVLFCSMGIQVEERYLKTAKMTSLLIFAPINTIFALPYLGHIMNLYKQKRINEDKMKKRVLILTILLLIVFTIENSYIKNFELGLLSSIVK